MNRVIRIASAALAALLLPALAGATEISNDAFSVQLPAAFAAPSRTTTAQSGIDTTTWIAKAPTGEAVVVSVSKMPAKIADPVKLMDSTRDSLLKTVKGTLENEQALSGDMPSRRILFQSGTAFLRSRLVVSGDKLYQLLYVGRSLEERNAPAVGAMFDTFHIATPPATASAAPSPNAQ